MSVCERFPFSFSVFYSVLAENLRKHYLVLFLNTDHMVIANTAGGPGPHVRGPHVHVTFLLIYFPNNPCNTEGGCGCSVNGPVHYIYSPLRKRLCTLISRASQPIGCVPLTLE